MLPPLEAESLQQPRFQQRPLYRSIFPFTHHRITLSVYRRAAPKRIAPAQRWFKSIDRVAMPSPHRRAIDALLYLDFSAQHKQDERRGNGR